MYTFSLPSYLIIAAILVLCLVAVRFFHTRIKRQITTQTNLPYKKYGLLSIGFGAIVVLASLFGYFKVQSDISKSPPIFQPVSWMTSEPILLLVVSGVLVGMAALVIGIFYFRYGSSVRGA